mgnify:FL=1|tara:strand:+ start:3775 stop:4740 length:966 start_codon:yes stop_codon:yes gene_type:complete
MPITTSEVHVDQALTNVSIAYAQESDSFVASRIFNSINTSQLSNKYHVFDKDQWLRSQADLRGTGSPTKGANFTMSTGTFSCQQYGMHMDVDDYVAANADAGVDILTSATQYVTEKLLQKRDEVFAAAAFTTSVWTGSSSGSDITPSTKWSASGGTPIKDISDQQAACHAKTGRTPNVLLLGKDVYSALRDSDDLLDRVKYSEKGIVTTDLMASLFGVDEVIVASSIENTALEGATAVYAPIFDADDALLIYRPQNPGLLTPAAGYMFSFTGVAGADQFEGLRTLRYRMDANHSERIEALAAFDFKVTGADLGVYFDEAVA